MCSDWWVHLGPRSQESTVHDSTGDCVTVLDSPVLDWASGTAVSIFSGSGFFSAVVERTVAAELLRGEPETLVPLPRILEDLWPHAALCFLAI